MKPVQQTTITHTGSLGGEVTAMTIRPEDMKYIMSFLTDMYSDPEMAVIREYSANAIDSHRMAGNPAPIEITTPSPFAQFFKIKDYGLGLSKTEIQQVYAMYGNSTKRDTNEAIGSFGLGSKSALTYTNSFIVTAVKDGMKVQVAIYRNDDMTGSAEVISEEKTKEPNSVEVSVPIKTYNAFHQKANQFFRFWEPGTVLVNGAQPKHFEGDKITVGVLRGKNNAHLGSYEVFYGEGLEKSYIVMGNVAYPIQDSHYHKNKFVAYVPIGTFGIAPNREELIYTDQIKAQIDQISREFNDGLFAVAKKDIESKTDAMEAWHTFVKWNQRVSHNGFNTLKFKGHAFTHAQIVYDKKAAGYGYTRPQDSDVWEYNPNSYYRSKVQRIVQVATNDIDKLTFVYNFRNAEPTPANKRKMKYWLDQGHGKSKIVLMPDQIKGNPWLDTAQWVDWTVIDSLKLPKAAGVSHRKTILGSWDKFKPAPNRYNYTEEITTIDTSKPLVYVSTGETQTGWRQTNPSVFYSLLPADAIYLNLGKNRWPKFKRDFPHALHLTEWAKAEAEKIIASWTDAQRMAIGMDDDERMLLKKFDVTKVKHQELKDMINAANIKLPSLDKLDELNHLLRTYGKTQVEVKKVKTEVYTKYPLLKFIQSNAPVNEIYTYLNAVGS